MADLTDQQKLEVVLALAQFTGPQEIVNDFKARGIEVSYQAISIYDPTKSYFAAGERWREIFMAERKRYLEEVQAVPIANQGYRLNILQKNLDQAIKTGNRMLANSTLEQAAKEVGGALTNERNVNMKRPVEELSADERRAMFAEIIAKAMEAKDPPGTAPTPPAMQ